MNTRNLIPQKRLELKMKRHAIRRWSLINGVYLSVLAASATVLCMVANRGSTTAGAAALRTEVARSTATLASLRHQAMVLKVNLQANRELSQVPDWSILLSAISTTLGDDVLLNRIDSIEDHAAADHSVAGARLFHVSGIGRSQEAVTQFVLKLEGLHFFTRVRLVQTMPQILHGADAIGFDLECSLQSTEGGR